MPQTFNKAVMPNTGVALLARAQLGEITLEFTRLAIGAGVYSAAEKAVDALQARTALKDERNSYTFSKREIVSGNAVKLTSIISNADLETDEALVETGYYINEMGLFAKPHGAPDSQEVLYSIVVTAGDQGDYLPAYNGHNLAQIVQGYITTVSNSAEVIINSSGAAALLSDFEALEARVDIIEGRFGELDEVKADVLDLGLAVEALGAADAFGSDNVILEDFEDADGIIISQGSLDTDNNRLMA